MVVLSLAERVTARRKNPISAAVSALDVRLGVLGWASRELADISAYAVPCVSAAVLGRLPLGGGVLIDD